MIGRRIGPYEVLAKIGEGGMGEVYRARDTRLNRTVAIKIVRTDFSERFEREAKSISALNHPHICTLHDVGHTDDFAYLVMEYVEGGPIAGPLPVEEVLRLGMQICDALHAAHQKGIVHRDLKPANILSSKAGIKLLDFGLAKPRASSSQSSEQATVAALTGAHTIVGTPQYMAPEQIEGRDVDVRTDIFALGCVLYELVTGKRAFDGKTASNVMAAILATEPRKPSELVPVTPPVLEWIILRCLEKDPDARWQSVHDIRLQLQWLAGFRSTIPPIKTVMRPMLRLYFVGVTSGLLLAATVAAVWLGFFRTRPDDSSIDRAPRHIAMSFPLPPNLSIGPLGERSSIAIAPDGRTVAFVGARGEETAIYVRHLGALDAVKVAGTDGGSGPFFSPKGDWIGFRAEGKLKRVPVAGGTAVDITDAGALRGSVWLDDDTIVYSPSPVSGLMRVSASGGPSSVLTKLDPAKHEKTHRSLIGLPGGKAVVFVIGSDEIGTYNDGRIVALTLETQKITELATGFAPAFSPTGHLLFVQGSKVMAIKFDPVTLKTEGSPQQVLEGVATLPGWGTAAFDVSPTGVLAYAPGGDRSQLVDVLWANRLGQLQTIALPERSYFNPRFTSDGSRLLLSTVGANNRLWTYDFGRSLLAPLTFRLDVDGSTWSHDGSDVTYWSGVDLRSIAADGSKAEEILVPAAAIDRAILRPSAWSADGQTLALTQLTLTDSDVAVYSRRDGKVHSIAPTRFTERAQDLSPDGRWLLYVSNESDRPQLYVRDLTAPNKRYQLTTEGAVHARWMRDGREVMFGNFQKYFAATFSPGTPPTLGKADTLFPQAKVDNWDSVFDPVPHPDGNRFIVLLEKPSPPLREIRVVTNWAQQLSAVVR